MAQQEEPLYDFPEPAQPSQSKLLAHQRCRGSLRSISVLDRLLLTVPVWLQLSINAATALHILQKEPPGNFLVRKSRTSQRNVLCVRLADDSVPSFVQQFGIREEHSSKTLTLETSAVSFPDLPRLISFYCVSRDVLPFPLELPEAIAKATSHKELESISHMGIEFWSSHLNVRGPREPPKPQTDEKKKPDAVTSAPPVPDPQTIPSAQPDPASQPDSDDRLKTAPEPDAAAATKESAANPTLFHEFCPITTRSPLELDCGSGQGALCFINPLFLRSDNARCRRGMFKRSLKVRISTETSTLLSPPLAPPPPPPLMPKTRGKCKAQEQAQGEGKPGEAPGPGEAQIQPPSAAPYLPEAAAQLPTITEDLPGDSNYMQPSPMINLSQSPLFSSYLSPSVSPMAPPLFPKASPSPSPNRSPGASPPLSPYQSPSVSPMAPPLFPKVSSSLSPYDSPSGSPSLSPYQSPSPSRKAAFSLSPYDSPSASPSLSPSQCPLAPFSLSPFTSPALSQLAEQVYHTPAPPLRADRQRPEGEAEEQERQDDEMNAGKREKDESGLVLQMNAATLSDKDSCSSFSSLEGAAENPPRSPHKQDAGTSL